MHTATRPKNWTFAAPLLVALLISSTACASSGTSGSGGDRNLLTHAQLVESGEPDLQQAIQRLRPVWLRARGQSLQGRTVMVFVDGAPRGDISELRGMQIINVLEVTYVGASEAGFRYGTLGGAGGVIEVKTRR